MPRLLVTEGIDAGKQFDLTAATIFVGRDSASGVRLLDTEVSRKHVELRQTEAGYRLLDLGSANGVFLNGLPIRDAVLQPGDRLLIGKTTLLYSAAAGEPVQAPLAEQIRVVTRGGDDLPSAIVRKLGGVEGSRILSRPEDARSPWLRTRLANLAIMYEATKELRQGHDLSQLLDKILELLFRSVEADRGCVMLRDGDSLEAKAVRWRDGAPREEIAVSHSIVSHVLREHEGVLVEDAPGDSRFRGGASIVRLGIREAICVPMMGRHEAIGVLYFDTFRTTKEAAADPEATKFTEDHLALAVAVAHQAALAVEETRYYQALVQSERLAAVGQAIAALSHHIKNILQGMKSGGEILALGLAEKDDRATAAGWRLVQRNQARIYDLVLDMLSYSKEREPGFEACDLGKVVRDVVELMQPKAAERGINLTVELSEVPITHVDPEGMHRALLNLVTNAIDAVDEAESPTVNVTLRATHEWIELAVKDNGCGIEPAMLGRLFKPFESTKGASGTGLGLAVSRKTLREHGGDIVVDSRAGQGSTFTMRVPVRDIKAVQ